MEKILPHNLEAERSLLGGILIDSEAMIKIADLVHPMDFYKVSHQRIFEAMLELYQNKEPIDILSLSEKLKEKGFLEEIGGASYLSSLTSLVPTTSHLEHYAKIVKEKSILRSLIGTSYKIAQECFEEKKEISLLLDEIQQEVISISQKGTFSKFQNLKEFLKEAFERIDRLHRGEKPLRGLTTGFSEIDQMLAGFQKANLVVLAARPSLGKTALALDFARAIALKEKLPVGIFSLEMSKEEIVDRLIAAQSGVDLWRIRTGRLKEEIDFNLIERALDKLSQAPIFIDDTPSLDILQIRTMARKLQIEHGLGALIIDYLQLIRPLNNNESEVQQISEVSRFLKSLARELQVPVIAVSQLSRAVEQRESRIPRLSDLRASGSIEQDADIVMFIYRKDKDKKPELVSPEERNTAQIIIAKHRNGPTGSINLKFDPGCVSFRSIDELHKEAEF